MYFPSSDILEVRILAAALSIEQCHPELGALGCLDCLIDRYKDIGMACEFEATAKTEDELMKKIAGHAGKAHNMKTMPPNVMQKVKKAIKK